MSPADIFTTIYRQKLWGDGESVSGHGSSLEMTRFVRPGVSRVVRELGIQRMLDLPCGDSVWIHELPELASVKYFGADIVPELVQANSEKWPYQCWDVLDVVEDHLPTVDLVFCRDCLVHQTLEAAQRAIRNIKLSGSKYLMMTTFPSIPEGNGDIPTGHWRRLDFTATPFNLPAPIILVNECNGSPSNPGDKSLGVWRLEDI